MGGFKSSKKRKIETSILKKEIGALIYNARNAKLNYLIDDQINLNSLINTIINNNKFINYQILESSNINISILDKYFLTIFYKEKINDQKIINNYICKKLITNISSITPGYIASC